VHRVNRLANDEVLAENQKAQYDRDNERAKVTLILNIIP
jgi:hypothetical protein